MFWNSSKTLTESVFFYVSRPPLTCSSLIVIFITCAAVKLYFFFYKTHAWKFRPSNLCLETQIWFIHISLCCFDHIFWCQKVKVNATDLLVHLFLPRWSSVCLKMFYCVKVLCLLSFWLLLRQTLTERWEKQKEDSDVLSGVHVEDQKSRGKLLFYLDFIMP